MHPLAWVLREAVGCCWKEITWPNIEPCGNFNNLNNKMHTCSMQQWTSLVLGFTGHLIAVSSLSSFLFLKREGKHWQVTHFSSVNWTWLLKNLNASGELSLNCHTVAIRPHDRLTDGRVFIWNRDWRIVSAEAPFLLIDEDGWGTQNKTSRTFWHSLRPVTIHPFS